MKIITFSVSLDLGFSTQYLLYVCENLDAYNLQCKSQSVSQQKMNIRYNELQEEEKSGARKVNKNGMGQ